jgi:hypothetical protein
VKQHGLVSGLDEDGNFLGNYEASITIMILSDAECVTLVRNCIVKVVSVVVLSFEKWQSTFSSEWEQDH